MSGQYSYQLPTMTMTHKVIMILTSCIFLLGAIISKWSQISLTYLLGLSWPGIQAGYLWSIFTYPFYHADFMTGLFNLLVLWFTGNELELFWGRTFYHRFLFVNWVLGGLLFVAIGVLLQTFFHVSSVSLLFGLSGINYALLVAYAQLFPDREFSFLMLFPMKAKWFCILLGVIELYQILFSNYAFTLWGHVLTAVVGFAYLKLVSWQVHHRKSHPVTSQAEKLRKSFKLIHNDEKIFKKSQSPDPKDWH